VRGAGTLVPEEKRWITSLSSGRVEDVILRPGAHVEVGTVILTLSNQDQLEAVKNAERAYNTSKANLENTKATNKANRAAQESAAADADGQLRLQQVNLEAQQKLLAEGLVSDLTVKQFQQNYDSAKLRADLAHKQLQIAIDNEVSQIAPQEAAVIQAKAAWDQELRKQEDLKVKSTMKGVLQAVPVERGQNVGAGTNLAQVTDPTNLKAEIRISETQTKDLAIGQYAEVDTRSGIVKGHVTRMDPAATGGTIGVDVTLDEALPAGARQDMSVDGTIELQRLENVLYVQRPSFGQENQAITVFKIVSTTGPVAAAQEAGHEAVRTPVTLGRASVQFIEVKSGLQEGDRIVLSDMSQYDAFDRIRLN
jgi:HlyD family secretion protein